MKPYYFQDPLDFSSIALSIRELIQKNKLIKFVPTMTNTSGTVTIGEAYVILNGPMAYVSYLLYPTNGSGWTGTAVLDLPVVLNPSVGGVPTTSALLPIYKPLAASLIGYASPYLDGTPGMIVSTGYTNVSGSTETIGISGWFLRK